MMCIISVYSGNIFYLLSEFYIFIRSCGKQLKIGRHGRTANSWVLLTAYNTRSDIFYCGAIGFLIGGILVG